MVTSVEGEFDSSSIVVVLQMDQNVTTDETQLTVCHKIPRNRHVSQRRIVLSSC